MHFRHSARGRAPTVVMEALSSSGERKGSVWTYVVRTHTGYAMCVRQIVVHVCVYLHLFTSLYTVSLCMYCIYCKSMFKSQAYVICIHLVCSAGTLLGTPIQF